MVDNLEFCTFDVFQEEFKLKHTGTNIIIFDNVSVTVTIECRNVTRNEIWYNVNVIPLGCRFDIPNRVQYNPTHMISYTMQELKSHTNITLSIGEFQLEELKINKVNTVEYTSDL